MRNETGEDKDWKAIGRHAVPESWRWIFRGDCGQPESRVICKIALMTQSCGPKNGNEVGFMCKRFGRIDPSRIRCSSPWPSLCIKVLTEQTLSSLKICFSSKRELSYFWKDRTSASPPILPFWFQHKQDIFLALTFPWLFHLKSDAC